MEEYLLLSGVQVNSAEQTWTGPGCRGVYGGGGGLKRRRRNHSVGGERVQDGAEGGGTECTGVRAGAWEFVTVAETRLVEWGVEEALEWLSRMLDVKVSPIRGEGRHLVVTLECEGQSWDVKVPGGGRRVRSERSLRAECYVTLQKGRGRGAPGVQGSAVAQAGRPAGSRAARRQGCADWCDEEAGGGESHRLSN